MSGLKDIKSSLRGAKLPNGQPMLLDEEQNSLALLIEQVSTAALQHCSTAAPPLQARHELNCGDPRKAECYMSQADTINDQEPLVKIVRGVCKVGRRGRLELQTIHRFLQSQRRPLLVDVKLRCRRNYHKRRVALRHYANQPAHLL